MHGSGALRGGLLHQRSVEVHLYPNRHVPDIPALEERERDDFAEIYLDVLRRLDLHLEVFAIRRAADMLKYLAGSEAGMGVFISDVVPEDVAARLRDLNPPPS